MCLCFPAISRWITWGNLSFLALGWVWWTPSLPNVSASPPPSHHILLTTPPSSPPQHLTTPVCKSLSQSPACCVVCGANCRLCSPLYIAYKGTCARTVTVQNRSVVWHLYHFKSSIHSPITFTYMYTCTHFHISTPTFTLTFAHTPFTTFTYICTPFTYSHSPSHDFTLHYLNLMSNVLGILRGACLGVRETKFFSFCYFGIVALFDCFSMLYRSLSVWAEALKA